MLLRGLSQKHETLRPNAVEHFTRASKQRIGANKAACAIELVLLDGTGWAMRCFCCLFQLRVPEVCDLFK